MGDPLAVFPFADAADLRCCDQIDVQLRRDDPNTDSFCELQKDGNQDLSAASTKFDQFSLNACGLDVAATLDGNLDGIATVTTI